MKKIGLLYICTGPYIAFWKDFFETSEKYFLEDFEKHYYVFCDQKIDSYGADNRVHYIHIDNMPWPLITLLRYHFFLSIKEELIKMDYLMFSNANMKFVSRIEANEMLPNKENDEEIFVVMHPGYGYNASCQAPFERSKKSTAYVPYNYKGKYVIGAMNGGTSVAFLKMSEEIKNNTDTDLKKNIIAKWHDESQLNHYIYMHKKFRLLTPEYCYPYGIELDIEKKIIAVSKQEKFDVNSFKGMTSQLTVTKKIKMKIVKFFSRIKNYMCMIRDYFLFR